MSLKRLTYRAQTGVVRYRPSKGYPDSPVVIEWSGPEFVARMAALILSVRVRGEDSQDDPRDELWDGRQDFPTDDLPA